jgi:hypothetical protein
MRHAIPLIVFCLAWSVAAMGVAATLLVGPGGQYSTIQSAIDSANTGDTVQVLPGEYIENVVLKEWVEVVGAGAGECAIRSISESSPFATVEGKDNSTLRGFTITGGHYGIRCVGASPTVSDCVLWRNASCGMFLETSSPVVNRCLIAENPRYGVQCVASSNPAISNCTIAANGYGVFSSASNPVLTNCILWDNWDDLEGIAQASSVSHCDIQDGDFSGINGNISANPAFLGWGTFNDSDNQLYVEAGYDGPQAGTQENPFAKIGAALSVYTYHLGTGSPCLNAGEGNVHMGAFPDESPTNPPGSDRVIVNASAGTYYEDRLFVCHAAQVHGSERGPARIVAFGDTVFFVLGRSSVQNFVISGGDNAIACFFSEAQVSNCVVLECGQNGIYSFQSTPTIRSCHMVHNPNSGIHLEGGSGTVSDCTITQQGSAGISCAGGSSATITNCLLTENPLGLSCGDAPNVELRNCTVANGGWRGVESRDGASVKIVNSVVWENAFGELVEEGGSIQASFSDVRGGFPGEGNLDANPLFAGGALGYFYLDSDSPCLDKGTGTPESFGLEGKTTLKTSQPDTGTVDIGYHYERFAITGIARDGGRIYLQWNSTPGLGYAILRTNALGIPPAWQLLIELTATRMRETYFFDEPQASPEFYRITPRRAL